MANADFSREQNQTPGGFDSGSYREAKRPDNETVRLDPLQHEADRLEKALPTAMAKQGTALVLSVAVMLAAFVGFGGAKVRGKYNEARQCSPPAFRPTTAMPERGADHPCQHGSEYHHHRREHAGG